LKEIALPFDPVLRSHEVEHQVMSGNRRKYYRFRVTGFYGGIVTADAVGCSFLCAYCWNYRRNLSPEKEGSFFSPDEVADKLLFLARRSGLNQMRISGAEPILGEDSFAHLIEVLKLLAEKSPGSRFILETNGLVLGQSRKFARSLARFRNLTVRVCLKATDREKFQLITGASRDYFFQPVQALLYLKEYGVDFWPALTADLFGNEEINRFRTFLLANSVSAELELERLIVYPFVEENLKSREIKVGRRQ
jgi:uncharacterized Fe-S cluster-containing radical SAM superfamily protein